jgi:predicted nuclease of predicted toxin-antitoxin system
VSDFDLLQTEDRRIWEFAKSNGFTIVTTDADFFELAAGHGAPPKVIWLRRWAHRTRDSELLLRTQAIRVAEFIQDPTPSVLVLEKS